MSTEKSFSTISLSVCYFLVMAFVMYYPFFRYDYIETPILLLDKFYNKILEVEFISKVYFNKFILLLTIFGAILLYSPKKDSSITLKFALLNFFSGVTLLILSDVVITYSNKYLISFLFFIAGFIYSVLGAIKLTKKIKFKNLADEDPFNIENETFLQNEVLIETEYSVNIKFVYRFKQQIREGWLNFVALFRAMMIIGTPGSGKSFAFFEEIIEQFIKKLFTMVIYDYKFDTLSKIAYNYYLFYKEKYKNSPDKLKLLPEFYFICFNDVKKSHRCNPIDPYLMKSKTDADNASESLMKNLNKEWIKKKDFFSRSAISFVSGLIWYLKKKSEEYGKDLCTLPHVITLSTINIEVLLEIMLKDIEVRSILIPFKDALEREASQQLSGQTASAQISLSMLANKELYYITSGNDFTLDINNPRNPKIISLQNNPLKDEVYAAPLGLYINKILQVVNQPGKRPLGLIIDELPTLFIMNLRKIIDTGRSNKIATILGIQSLAQLIVDYGKELANTIYDNCANIVCGSAKGETALKISELFGKIHQKRESKTITKNDVTINESTQLGELLPKSKLATFSPGTFSGVVADEHKNKIRQKLFIGEIKPNMDMKDINNIHELPTVNDFRPDDFNETFNEYMIAFEEISFVETFLKINPLKNKYIKFYHEYLPEFTNQIYDNESHSLEFIKLAKELKIFDHLNLIIDYKEKIISFKQIEKLFIEFVEEMIINNNIDRILDENFMNIMVDIDELVKNEYLSITGKEAPYGIFDKDKVNTEIETALSEAEKVSMDFMNDLNKASTKDLIALFSEEKSDNTISSDKISVEINNDDNNDDIIGTIDIG